MIQTERICGTFPYAFITSADGQSVAPNTVTMINSYVSFKSTVPWIVPDLTVGLTVKRTLPWIGVQFQIGFQSEAAAFDTVVSVRRNRTEELMRRSRRVPSTEVTFAAGICDSKYVQISAGDIISIWVWHNFTSNITPGGVAGTILLVLFLPDTSTA